MYSPKVGVDIEAQDQVPSQAQIKDISETPKIATNEDSPPAPNTANTQPPTNAEGLNEMKTPAPKTTYNSEIQPGISTFPFHNL